MGFLHQGVCYPDLPTVKAEVCSQANLATLTGGVMHTSSCTATDFDLSTYSLCLQADGGACNTVQAAYPAFPPCDHTYTTSLSISWLSAAFLLFATLWGLKTLIDLFSGKHDA